jgi:hypothetical protein
VNWRVNVWNLTSFPLGYGLCAAFFLACAFYAARLEAGSPPETIAGQAETTGEVSREGQLTCGR